MSTPPLDKNELIGRGVFSSKLAVKARKKVVGHQAFLEHVSVDRISVDRVTQAPLSFFIGIGNRIASTRRNGKRNFYGWAVLKVEDAESEFRKVESTPIDGNPHHADICLLNLPNDHNRRSVQIDHAVALAADAEWWDADS